MMNDLCVTTEKKEKHGFGIVEKEKKKSQLVSMK